MTTTDIAENHQAFLEKVQAIAGLSVLYEVRDLAEVVFRRMGD